MLPFVQVFDVLFLGPFFVVRIYYWLVEVLLHMYDFYVSKVCSKNIYTIHIGFAHRQCLTELNVFGIFCRLIKIAPTM